MTTLVCTVLPSNNKRVTKFITKDYCLLQNNQSTSGQLTAL